MTLIVVESPTKARTFNRILKAKKWDTEYYVFPTVGHFRDLPADKISIDYSQDFKPEYEIMMTKQRVIDNLRKLAESHKKIILATDPDREGEAISYHVAFVLGHIDENWPNFTLKNSENVKRIVFHEITAKALEEALAQPGDLRINLVKAQQGRRILDRVVGYELSPLLWKKTGKNWLSAGRVQTVALRLVVEREAEIQKFAVDPYFQVYAFFTDSQQIKAKLISKDGQVYEQKTKIALFAGEYEYAKTTITKDNVGVIEKDLRADQFTITDIKEEVISRYPPPPYSTSLLQQDAFQKFGYPSKLTMRLAQSLYERGLITYHRTDSFHLSTQFVFRAMDYIAETYGKEYALEKPRGYKTRSRLAQEAHEAIRPTKLERDPKTVDEEGKLSPPQMKLYELIFNRALATQMKEAQVKQTKVYITSGKQYLLESDFSQVLFDGFMRLLWPEFSKKHQDQLKVAVGEKLKLESLELQELATKPPPRYTEASLIRILEEKGIGRPSTYAPIISLIQDKNYITKDNRYFVPTELGTAIGSYLSKAFPQLFDLAFTAGMEEGLDQIAEGAKDVVNLLRDFYTPFLKELDVKKDDDSTIEIKDMLDEKCPQCGHQLTIKYSRYGKFFPCSNYPACKFIKPNLKFLPNQFCPLDKGQLVIRYSKSHKRFYGCENYPKCTYVQWGMKPKEVTKNPPKATKRAVVKTDKKVKKTS